MEREIEKTLIKLLNRVDELEERVTALEKKRRSCSNELQTKINPTKKRIPLSFEKNSDVQEAIHYLIFENLLTEDEVKNLCDESWCLKNLRLNFPLFREVYKGKFDESGYSRYWKEIVELFSNEYYVCSQWYEYNRKEFEKWFKEKINSLSKKSY